MPDLLRHREAGGGDELRPRLLRLLRLSVLRDEQRAAGAQLPLLPPEDDAPHPLLLRRREELGRPGGPAGHGRGAREDRGLQPAVLQPAQELPGTAARPPDATPALCPLRLEKRERHADPLHVQNALSPPGMAIVNAVRETFSLFLCG